MTSSPPRSAALAPWRATSSSRGSWVRRSMTEKPPAMAAMTLLKSWAMPEVSWPTRLELLALHQRRLRRLAPLDLGGEAGVRLRQRGRPLGHPGLELGVGALDRGAARGQGLARFDDLLDVGAGADPLHGSARRRRAPGCRASRCQR